MRETPHGELVIGMAHFTAMQLLRGTGHRAETFFNFYLLLKLHMKSSKAKEFPQDLFLSLHFLRQINYIQLRHVFILKAI